MPILVVFFGIGITAQMAAIKLAGGFFYSKEAHSQIILKSGCNAGVQTDFCLDRLLKFSTSSGRAGGADMPGILSADVFVWPASVCGLSLAAAGRIFARYFYKSDCIRIRPPLG